MHPGSLRVLRPSPSALEGLDEAGLSGSPLAEELERSEQASIIQRSSWAVVGLFGLLCILSWIRRPPSLAFNPKGALVSLGQTALIFGPATTIAFFYDPRSLDTMLGLTFVSLTIGFAARMTAETVQPRTRTWLLGATITAHIAGAVAVASSKPNMVYFFS